MATTIDDQAIAQAIATRFTSANVTPPTGEDNIRVSTEQLPDRIGPTPTVLVFPSEDEVHVTASTRSMRMAYPVSFYLYKTQDTPRQAARLNKWRKVLRAQLDSSTQLSLSDYVATAEVTGVRAGTLTYADEAFDGVELIVTVGAWEGVTFA